MAMLMGMPRFEVVGVKAFKAAEKQELKKNRKK